MKKFIFLLFISVATFAQNKYAIIPKPSSLTPQKGEFVLNSQTKILIPQGVAEIRSLAELLRERMAIVSGINLPIEEVPMPFKAVPANRIVFAPFSNIVEGKTLGEEYYLLNVKPQNIVLAAASAKGQFYGLQTIFQLLPTQIFQSSKSNLAKWSLPACSIFDHPRYQYRGLHLDVGRHFFPVSFIKKYIDLIAMHKMNTFHWHLTEDQGWRIEIKKYPKLTEIGSKRKETTKGHLSDQLFDNTPHEGFYTQEEIKDVVKYAQSKFVNIIPEIEMPGHAMAALAAYPELGCKGKGYEVGTRWGVYDDVFCPTEQTFTFLQDVLTEVMELFPSKFIHIGGDECPKISWKESQFCQDLMKKEGLKDEHELQSYFIKRIDNFLTSKGRRLIGWDEILEGGISPNATIMSWRGIDGGIAAAKQHHDAIMTPGDYCYLDLYQSDPATEPLAIGGFLPLEKVYSYNPTPAELSAEEAKHILGVQGNLWTEYIATPEHAEYMAFPRALAIAEVGWTPNELKNFKDFSNRLKTHLQRLTNMGVNYSKSFYDLTTTTHINAKRQAIAKLKSPQEGTIIRYTLNGSNPTKTSPIYQPTGIVLSKDGLIKAASFTSSGKQLSNVMEKYLFVNKSTGKPYTLGNSAKKYFGGENFALTNGVRGGDVRWDDWVGFDGNDFDFTIDLGKTENIGKVSVAFLQSAEAWIMPPQWIEVLVSADGKTYTSVKKVNLGDTSTKGRSVKHISMGIDNQKARFVKVYAKNYGVLPIGHSAAGSPAWLFVDEVGIE